MLIKVENEEECRIHVDKIRQVNSSGRKVIKKLYSVESVKRVATLPCETFGTFSTSSCQWLGVLRYPVGVR